MADILQSELQRTIAAATQLDIRLTDLTWSLPKSGGTDLQKGARKRLSAAINNVRELRRYLDDINTMNEELNSNRQPK